MKKIILLLTALFAFAGAQANQYRVILPYPYVEKITSPAHGSATYLNTTGQHLTVHYSYPQTYYSTDELRTKINELIAAEGIASWLTVNSVTMNTSAHTGSITFDVLANNTGTTRVLRISAGSTEISCYQSAAALKLSCLRRVVLPGQNVTLRLSGSTPGEQYNLYRDKTLVATATGTGSSLEFVQRIPDITDENKATISYEVWDLNLLDSCILTYPDAILRKQGRTVKQHHRVDQQGGEIVLRCSISDGDINDVAAVFLQLNECGTEHWDISRVTITAIDYEEKYCDLSFNFKENADPTPILFRSVFLFDADGTEVVFEQEARNPDPDRNNWIRTRTYTKEKGLQWNSDIDYYDGLGRKEQTVKKWWSPLQKDLVTLFDYDDFGRLAKEWLPLAEGNDGNRKDPATIRSEARSDFKDEAPFTQTVYESSPMNRIQEQWAPGQVMHTNNARTTTEYGTNEEDELLIPYADHPNRLAIAATPVQAGTYFKQITTDADGHVTHTFTDQQGNTILSRRIADGETFDTYYFYDFQHRLRGVMSPQGSRYLKKGTVYTSSDTLLRNYGYRYTPDPWGNVINRWMAGRDYELNFYDTFDRLRARRDGVQRINGEWEIFHYDSFGRLLWSGIVGGNISNKEMNDKIRNGTLSALYDNPDFSLSAAYWYDKMPSTADPDLSFSQPDTDWPERDTRTRGLKTYEKLSVLGASNVAFVERAFYYDVKGRLIQTAERNHLGTISRYSSKYDFSGNVLATRESHQNPETYAWDAVEIRYTYDRRGRKTSETSTLKNATAEVRYHYDESGRLGNIFYGNNGNTVEETRKYNLQNWLITQNSPLFSMRLRYYDPLVATTVPSYTGNITEFVWQHSGSVSHKYVFAYDGLSRLTGTEHYTSGNLKNMYAEKGITYDANGNILTLQRTSGGTVTDSLDYTYSGNWLISLNGAPYIYDRNGNMKRDGQNGLSITYNRLNRIEKVSLSNGGKGNYSYLSDGTKISATNSIDNGLVYLGSLVYMHRLGKLSLESAPFGEGRWNVTSNGAQITYFIKDHLGSVRSTFNEEGLIMERNDYYPFGARWYASSIYSNNRYRYNGKEEQEFLNLPFSDYGARMYDPGTGRWVTSDPLSEKFYSVSPYAFCLGNPINYFDPDGNKVFFAQGVSQEFKDKFAATVQYMNERGTSGDLAALEKSENIYYINEGVSGSFDYNSNTLYWNPNEVVMTENEIILFPATILAHESKHGRQKDEMNPNEFNEKKENDSNNPYGNKLEEEVISGTEQIAAEKHGDKTGNNITRNSHQGIAITIRNNLPSKEILENYRQDITEHVRKILENR